MNHESRVEAFEQARQLLIDEIALGIEIAKSIEIGTPPKNLQEAEGLYKNEARRDLGIIQLERLKIYLEMINGDFLGRLLDYRSRRDHIDH